LEVVAVQHILDASVEPFHHAVDLWWSWRGQPVFDAQCRAKRVELVKWSGKFGQRAKMYPARTDGYENDKVMELFRPV
jgi:hypothetical protein